MKEDKVTKKESDKEKIATKNGREREKNKERATKKGDEGEREAKATRIHLPKEASLGIETDCSLVRHVLTVTNEHDRENTHTKNDKIWKNGVLAVRDREERDEHEREEQSGNKKIETRS